MNISKLVAWAAAGGAIAGAATNLIPPTGGSFSLPAFSWPSVKAVYGPIAAGTLVIFPRLFPGAPIVGAGGLFYFGIDRVLIQGDRSFSGQNILSGWLPLAGGGVLLAKLIAG